MGLNFEAKQAVVAEVAEVAVKSLSVIVAEYSGLTVADMTELRKSARDEGVYLRVVRNTLARRALEGTNFACINEDLTGQTVLAFSGRDVGSAAKVIRDFIKQNGKLAVRSVALENKLLQPSDIHVLADLPNKEEALAMLMGTMIAPVSKLLGTFSGVTQKIVGTVRAIADQKRAE